jgi:zinc-ribbon domain
MALLCGRCGTQNPDGNRFCQSCGTPLSAPAPQPAVPVGAAAASPFTQSPPGAPAYVPPPPAAYAGPPAYASPYYTPGPGQPGVHRTPWVLIIAVIVALVVVMGGIGTVAAFVLASHNTQTSGFNAVSSPSPAVSSSPGHSPSPQPTQAAGNTASNDSLTVTIPSGWSVANKDNETISLESPNGDGAITIGAGESSPPQTAQQNKDTMDKYFLQKFPDTKPCPGSSVANGSISGANGIFWELCFTLTSGAQSVQVGAPLFVGANANGSVYYAVLLETEQSNINQFIAECKPILQGGIVWKLK